MKTLHSILIITLISTVISCQKKENDPVYDDNTENIDSIQNVNKAQAEYDQAKENLRIAEEKLREAKASGDTAATEAALKARNDAQAAWDAIKMKANETADAIEKGADATAEGVKNAANEVGDAAENAYQSTKKGVQNASEKMKEKSEEIKEDMKEDMKDEN